MAASQVLLRLSSPEPSPFDLAAAQFDNNSDYDEKAGRGTAPVDLRRDARPHGPGSISVDFGGLLPAPGLLVKEDATHGCGGRTWPAGMLLGRHLLRYRRDDLGDACVLELGAGGGLVALAVAKGCAITQPVLMTDIAIMVPLMEHNIALNGAQDKAMAAVLNWGEPIPEAIKTAKPSVILAADLAYFEPCFPLLLRTFSDLLELNPDGVVYFCQKRRRRADLKFIKSARKLFDVCEPEDDERVVFERQRMFLLEFRHRRGALRKSTRRETTMKEAKTNTNAKKIV